MDTTRIPREFLDLIALLNENSAEYLVVGGYAVNWHGYIRSTEDIDVWIGPDLANAERVRKALKQFGVEVSGVSAEALASPGEMFQLGNPPLLIEIMAAISGVVFPECYARRAVEEVHGVEVKFIGVEDLRKNKRASGRNKDLADLDYIP